MFSSGVLAKQDRCSSNPGHWSIQQKNVKIFAKVLEADGIWPSQSETKKRLRTDGGGNGEESNEPPTGDHRHRPTSLHTPTSVAKPT